MSDASPRWKRRSIYATIRAGTVAIGTAPKSYDLPAIVEAGEKVKDHVTIEGSGFVVDPRGMVITAKHVLKEWVDEREAMHAQKSPVPLSFPFVLSQAAQPETFTEGGDPSTADPDVWIIESFAFMTHDTLDLAAILLVGQRDLPAPVYALAPAEEPYRVGDEVIASGFPLGLRLHRDTAEGLVATPSISSGTISAILPTEAGPLEFRKAIQFDATIVRGASGGPVCDALTGHVVGMTTEVWELSDPQIPHTLGRAQDRFVAFPRAIPLEELRVFVERARRQWEMLLNPVTRFFWRASGGMEPMVGMALDHTLPWLPRDVQERQRAQE